MKERVRQWLWYDIYTCITKRKTKLENLYLSPSNIGGWIWKIFYDIIGDILHKPLKALAVVLLLELELFGDVPDGVAADGWMTSVEVFLELLVQPHLHHSHVILEQDQWKSPYYLSILCLFTSHPFFMGEELYEAYILTIQSDLFCHSVNL